MPWYMILLLIGVIVAPFDALYVYIKSERRREKLKRKDDKKEE